MKIKRKILNKTKILKGDEILEIFNFVFTIYSLLGAITMGVYFQTFTYKEFKENDILLKVKKHRIGMIGTEVILNSLLMKFILDYIFKDSTSNIPIYFLIIINIIFIIAALKEIWVYKYIVDIVSIDMKSKNIIDRNETILRYTNSNFIWTTEKNKKKIYSNFIKILDQDSNYPRIMKQAYARILSCIFLALILKLLFG